MGRDEEGSSDGAHTSETRGELREGREQASLAGISGRLSRRGRTQSDQGQEARILGGRKHFGGAQG